MTRDDVLNKLRTMLIHEMFVELPAEKITPDTLSTQLELDSIGFSELRLLCEHKFQIKIPDEDATHDNVHTLGRLIDLILRLKLSQANE